MIDGEFVAAFLNQVLTAVVDTFTAAGADLPDRRYVTFALPAADCAQVTVALQQLYLGTPGLPPTEPSHCNAPTVAVVRIEILRQVPIPEGRTTTVPLDQLVASSLIQIRDAELLLKCVTEMCGSEWGNMGVFADVSLGTEAGAYAGPVMTLTAGVP